MALISILCNGESRVTRSMRQRMGCPIGRDCGRCDFCNAENVLFTLTRAKLWFYFARKSCSDLNKYKFSHGAVDLELSAIEKKALHARLMIGDKITDRGLRKLYDRKKRELDEMMRMIRREERREARRIRRERRV